MNKQFLEEKLKAKKALLCSPLETLEEIMESEGLSKFGFAWGAMDCGLDFLTSAKFFEGEIPINAEIAKALESVLKTPTSFWLNLQASYDAELEEIEKISEILYRYIEYNSILFDKIQYYGDIDACKEMAAENYATKLLILENEILLNLIDDLPKEKIKEILKARIEECKNDIGKN